MGIRRIDELIDRSVAESHDDEDVQAALDRKTHDGAGDLVALPPSDVEVEK